MNFLVSTMEATSKAARRNNEDCSDRISELPDPILHYILSFLDIKHVILTAFLSKRWKTIFTSLPILNLDRNTLSASRHEINGIKFSDFVDRVLCLHDTNIDNNNNNNNNSNMLLSLRVSCFDEKMDMSHANTWCDFAVQNNLQELDLELSLGGYIQCLPLPHPVSLFSCNLLTTLKLFASDWLLIPHDLVVDLPKLKTLHLKSLCFHGEKINENFFSKCPALETLIITDCGIENDTLNIIVSEDHQLKYLKIESLLVLQSCRNITVSAPKLTSLSVKEEHGELYILVNIPSLVDARIEAGGFVNLMEFLKAISHVKSLTLSSDLFERYDRRVVIHGLHATVGVITRFNTFHSLRSLKLLKTTLCRDQIRGITHLLEMCPNVENIALEMSSEKGYLKDKIEGWKSELLLHHLKFIEIQDSTGCQYELEFLTFLLMHSPVLEKIIIFAHKKHLPAQNKEKFKAILASSTTEFLFL